MNDDISILEMMPQNLGRLAYRVETLLNPLEAVEFLRATPNRIDLIIMPQMTGAQPSETLKKIRTDLSVILCNGHSEPMDEEIARRIGIAAVVIKPITKHKIARINREVLDSRPAQPPI